MVLALCDVSTTSRQQKPGRTGSGAGNGGVVMFFGGALDFELCADKRRGLPLGLREG